MEILRRDGLRLKEIDEQTEEYCKAAISNNENFEWDSNKNAWNIQKHEIDFLDAIEVFSDERAVLRYDIAHSGDEERFLVVGMMRGIVVTAIVFTDRGDITRLISARKATREEELDYERNYRN